MTHCIVIDKENRQYNIRTEKKKPINITLKQYIFNTTVG